MNKIKWYGPTVLLLVTILLVLIGGPPIARQLAYEYDEAKIILARENLEKNTSLAGLSESFKEVARVVEKSVVSITVYSKSRAAGTAGSNPLWDRASRYSVAATPCSMTGTTRCNRCNCRPLAQVLPKRSVSMDPRTLPDSRFV